MNDHAPPTKAPQRPTPEYPDADQLKAYGALSFLYMRSEKYDMLSYRSIRALIQPPIDLRQFRVLEVEGVPRAALTYGLLSEEAEAKLISGEMVAPQDWNSGPRLWLMEIIAPYTQGKLGAKLVKQFLSDLPDRQKTVRFPRFASPGQLNYVTEYYRKSEGHWSSRRLTKQDLEDATSEGER